MRVAVAQKLKDNKKVMAALKDTKDIMIAYCCVYDRVWGTGINITGPGVTNRDNWGDNGLGKLLMEYRRDGV